MIPRYAGTIKAPNGIARCTIDASGDFAVTYAFADTCAIFALAWFYVERRGCSVPEAIEDAFTFRQRWGLFGVVQEVKLLAAWREAPMLP